MTRISCPPVLTCFHGSVGELIDLRTLYEAFHRVSPLASQRSTAPALLPHIQPCLRVAPHSFLVRSELRAAERDLPELTVVLLLWGDFAKMRKLLLEVKKHAERPTAASQESRGAGATSLG